MGGEAWGKAWHAGALRARVLWAIFPAMIARLPLLALVLTLLLPLPAAAQGAPDAAKRRYRDCMQLARTDPLVAEREAEAWIEEGGGGPAEHCRGVVDATLGRYGEAARRFESLADDLPGSDQRAQLLGQAGQAALLAGDFEKAYALQTRAITLSPKDPDLLVDRSLVLASMERYWEAIDDLNSVLELRPESPEALVFRAATYRLLGVPELAAEDLERALAAAPDHPEALLERALLAFDGGDEAGARRDLERILEVAPDSPAAEAARGRLAGLSAG